MHEAERGLFDLRRGRPLYVTPDGCSASARVVVAVEGLTRETLSDLRRFRTDAVRLAVTHHRAEAMGLADAASGFRGRGMSGLSLALNGETNPDAVLRLACTTGTHTTETRDPREASPPEIGGLTLARLGWVLPAVVSAPVDPAAAPELREALAGGSILSVSTLQIAALAENTEVTKVSEGPVPLEEAEDARFICFREANGLLEHLAILVGDRSHWADPVPVRIHSACLTGDLFGSLRCDCGEQLRGSLRVFAESAGGVLLYLAQEGRGIGLGNKLRAYGLQHDGLDTVDADCALGFGADERRYDAAVEMLRLLDIERVQLLTNNPEKVRALREAGIQVMDRQPLYGTLNRHNLLYVKAKVNRAGHWLGEMLSGAVPGK
jgi:GTP cyclohydrolase II